MAPSPRFINIQRTGEGAVTIKEERLLGRLVLNKALVNVRGIKIAQWNLPSRKL